MSPMSLFRHQNSRFVNNIMVATRNPGTKTDQDQENFEKFRPDGSGGQWIPVCRLEITLLWLYFYKDSR